MTEQPQAIGEIVLTPDWEALCLWFARALADHSFDRGARAPVRSLIDIVRFLAATDPEAVQRVMARLA